MHKSVASPNPPKRCGSHLVSRTLSRILNDAITSSNVVQREVAERMDYLIAQSGGHCECSTVDQRAWSGCCETTCVANRAADRSEKRITSNCRSRNRILSAGRARGCHEIGKCEHVIAII